MENYQKTYNTHVYHLKNGTVLMVMNRDSENCNEKQLFERENEGCQLDNNGESGHHFKEAGFFEKTRIRLKNFMRSLSEWTVTTEPCRRF